MDTEEPNDIHVVYMYYEPDMAESRPQLHLDCTSWLDGAELRKHASKRLREAEAMSPDSYRHYEWYSGVLLRELGISGCDSSSAAHPAMRVLHWRMDTSAVDAFRRHGVTYRYVSAVIGRSEEYAYYALPTHGGSNAAVEVMRPRGGVWNSPCRIRNQTKTFSPREGVALTRSKSFKPRRLFNIEEEITLENR